MDLAIIGSGYVGLVTGACFADVGHNVICVDNDAQKIKQLQAGEVPIYEPGLEDIIHRNVSAHRLRFTGSIEDGVENSQIVFIAVPTPQQPDGDVDLSFLEKVAREIAGVLTDYRVIVDKSTVPVKTGEKVAESIKRYNRHGANFDVVSNPEFLREGCAVADLMRPHRIGRDFLNAGIGYGGSCFPKDIAAFITISERLGTPFTLLREVQRINNSQKERFLKAIRETLWVLREKRIAVWGLTFKPDTDDVRSSVAVELVTHLLREGAHVVAYDPKGMQKARSIKAIADAEFASSALEAVTDAEALVIATEWNEFANMDLAVVKEKMRTPIVFDGRNLLDPETMRRLGFHYHSIGRANVKPQ